jgi:hypothetical protein
VDCSQQRVVVVDLAVVGVLVGVVVEVRLPFDPNRYSNANSFTKTDLIRQGNLSSQTNRARGSIP